MKRGETLKLALYYRLLATLSFVVGAAIVAGAVWAGLDAGLQFSPPDVSIEDPSETETAIFAAGTVVGLLVWQFGKSIALFRLVGAAVDSGTLDDDRLRSEVASTVDERISETSGGSPDRTPGSSAGGSSASDADSIAGPGGDVDPIGEQGADADAGAAGGPGSAADMDSTGGSGPDGGTASGGPGDEPVGGSAEGTDATGDDADRSPFVSPDDETDDDDRDDLFSGT